MLGQLLLNKNKNSDSAQYFVHRIGEGLRSRSRVLYLLCYTRNPLYSERKGMEMRRQMEQSTVAGARRSRAQPIGPFGLDVKV
jgi:hypothetical protein